MNMTYSRGSKIIARFHLFVFACVSFCLRQKLRTIPIDTSTAIRLIATKEKAVSVVRFKCRISEPWKNHPALSSVVDVAMDSDGHFRLEARGTERAGFGGEVIDSVGVDVISTFNGSIRREQEQYERGVAAPTSNAIPLGRVIERGKTPMAELGHRIKCLSYFFPYFFPFDDESGTTLSEYLVEKTKQGFPVRVNETDNGIWEISAGNRDIYVETLQKTLRNYIHIEYAPGKGKAGAVLKLVVSGHEKYADAMTHKPGNSWDEATFDLQVVEGFTVPRFVRVEAGFPGSTPTVFAEYTYGDVQLNRPLANDDFLIRWKKGTNVVDNVAGQRYVVSGTPVDEKKAVELFTRSHDLKPQTKLPEGRSRFIWVVGASSIVLAMLICVLIYRRWKKRKGTALSLLCVLLFASAAAESCRAQEVERETDSKDKTFLFDDGWWRVSDGTKETKE